MNADFEQEGMDGGEQVPSSKFQVPGSGASTDRVRPDEMVDSSFYSKLMGFAGKAKFRGEIWEYFKDVPMGRGYANEGKPFEIESACYLRPVQREIRQRRYGKFVIRAAVQMLKTMGTVEQPAGFFIGNDPGDMAIYLPADTSAFDQAKTRLMPYIRSLPVVREIVEQAESANRFDITTAELYLPGMTLRVWPLNETSTQRITLRYVLISDAFLSKSTGMIKQAIRRTTQHNTNIFRDYKIIIESQGGEDGDDFDKEWKETDQRLLHVVCPNCAVGQPFEWYRERDADFRATAPKSESSLDWDAWINYHTPILMKEENRASGMKRGNESLIKRPDGGYNEQEVLRQTYYECYHCGSAWRDTPPTRKILDESSYYVASNSTALEENIGFSWPSWAGQRLAWGGEFNMLGYLRAKEAQEKLGNVEDLKQWYQKSAAMSWSPRLSTKVAERPGATIYDEKEKIPGELCRISATDIQFRLTHMVYLACAVGDGVPPRVLHYEWVKPPPAFTEHQSREWCKARVRKLDEQFGIERQNSMKDAAHEPDLVREWAAEDAVFARIREGNRITQKWISYGLLLGDDKVSYRWSLPGRKVTWERFKQFAWVNVDVIKEGRRQRLPIHQRLWSNPSIKDIAERWRDGISAPKLQIHEKWLLDKSKEGLWAQLTSERKLPWRGHPGKLRYDNEGKPNHAWDAFCMVIVRMDELGYLNSFGVEESTEDN